MITHDAILAIMEKRFDHVSARVVLGEALKVAGLTASQKRFSPDEVRSLCSAVAAVGSRVEAVISALNDLADTDQAPAEKPAVEEEPVVEEKSALEEPPAPAPEEYPADAPDDDAAPKKKRKR